VGLAAVIWLLGGRMEAALRQTFLLGPPLLVVLAGLYVCAFQLQGLKQVVKSRLPPEVGRPLLVAGLVGVLHLLAPQHVSAFSALALNLFATAVTLLISMVLLRRALPPEVRTARAAYDTRHWTRVAMALLLLTAFFQVLSRTDVIMLGILANTKAAGIYAIAALVSQLVFLGLSAINVIAAPMISELYWRGSHAELQRLVRLAAIGVLATSIPALVVLVVFGGLALRLFGPTFGAGYAALVILCGGQLVNALAGSVGLLMSMTGHQKEAAGIVAVAAILNVALNLVLIPWFGMEGAAVATATTTALWNLAMLVYVWRHLGINPTILPWGIGHR
jgi:O-antigen/teichoic acid export membrane protein